MESSCLPFFLGSSFSSLLCLVLLYGVLIFTSDMTFCLLIFLSGILLSPLFYASSFLVLKIFMPAIYNTEFHLLKFCVLLSSFMPPRSVLSSRGPIWPTIEFQDGHVLDIACIFKTKSHRNVISVPNPTLSGPKNLVNSLV